MKIFRFRHLGFWLTLSALSLGFHTSCASQGDPSSSPQLKSSDSALIQAPRAEQKPKTLSIHGDSREDPYFWLREREKPEVRAYLEAENRFADQYLAANLSLQDKIFEEFKAKIPAVEESAPTLRRGYYYYSKQNQDQDYVAIYRRKASLQNPEELVVDFNELSKGYKFFQPSSVAISPDDRYLAYAFDDTGRRFFNIHVVDRSSKKEVLVIAKTTGNFEWANDSKTLVFSKQDPETLRSDRILRHEIGSQKDELIYEEKDTTFDVGVQKSRTDAYLFIEVDSTLTSEWRYIAADKPKSKPVLIQSRRRGIEYSVDDGGDRFYILTNYQAPNFQVMSVDKKNTSLKNWSTVVKANSEVFRKGIDVFKSHLVVYEREKGDDVIRVIDRKSAQETTVPFPDPVYQAGSYANRVYDTPTFNYRYQSLTKPLAVYSYNFQDGKQNLVKAQEIPGLDTSLYVTERVWVKARDGIEIPMSLVYKKGLKKDGTQPALIYGYGSYGINMDPTFSSTRLSLLDRGFVFAIAHIRGGSELGRPWYESGKLLKKKNTFNDFIDCSKYLIDQKYTSPKHLYAMGGSAGGLLMGAIINANPELYNGVVSQVPFVDVVTTMLDESIPLTTGEYDEWGNPNNKEYYDYIKSYSPYDNVKAQAYPNLLVVTGLHDSQVQYWEPAKWVAKIRTVKTDDNVLLLKTDMNAGHGGASGRFQSLKDLALWWSFFVRLENEASAHKTQGEKAQSASQ